MIDKHYDVQSGDTIYISNIATVDRSDKNQILKDCLVIIKMLKAL